MPLTEIGVILNPEHYAAWGSMDGSPHWPESCTVCGADHIQDGRYGCGAEYSRKSQCQTHTEVYWGLCPSSCPSF